MISESPDTPEPSEAADETPETPARLRLGTRGSELALWQARAVADALGHDPYEVEIVPIKTTGDRVDDRPLVDVEGSAFFTKEIERALIDGEIDAAVHSAKDLETTGPPELVVAAITERANPAEMIVVAPEMHDARAPFLPLRSGARVGTSAPRRRAQLRALRPDLDVVDLRGNVPTRVDRVRRGRLDAVVLAAAGIERLGLDLSGLVAWSPPVDVAVPAPAQGALAIQARAADTALVALLRERLHHEPTARCVEAERTALTAAGGGCHLPLGAYVRGEGPFEVSVFLGGDSAAWAHARADDPIEGVRRAYERITAGEPTGDGPFGGLFVSVVGSSSRRSDLGARLAVLGARVGYRRVLAFEEVSAPSLPARVAKLSPGDAIAVTSREAARRLTGLRVPDGVKVAVVGAATRRALVAAGIQVHFVGSGGGRALGQSMPVEPGGRVLFPCSLDPHPDLPRALAARGIDVEALPLYRTRARTEAPPRLEQLPDARVYMSPSSVSAAVSLGLEDESEDGFPRIALGFATYDAMVEAGIAAERPAGSGPDAVVAALARLVARRREQEERP